MKIIKPFLLGLFSFIYITPSFGANQISVCTSNEAWYPILYTQNGDVSGIQIDIIKKAFQNLNLNAKFITSDFDDCLEQAKNGTVDAIATASYKKARAAYLHYPEGAEDIQNKNPLRVTQILYRVVTPVNSKNGKNFTFSGKLEDLPPPVRVTAKYTIAEDLKKSGVTIQEGKNAEANYKNMMQENTGSLVDLEEYVTLYSASPQFRNKTVVQNKPIKNLSYFLPFSKKSSLQEKEIANVWQEIARIRDNPTEMKEILKKY